MKLLIVGKNSMIAREFINSHNVDHELVAVGKEDDLAMEIERHSQFDSVIFLAQSNDYKAPYFTQDLYDTNINLLFTVLNLVKDRAQQFIYFSSGSVYQSSETGIYTEQSPLDMRSASPYIASKIAGEIITSSFQKYLDSVIVLRPFYMYGKGQKANMLMSTIFHKIAKQESVALADNKGLIFNPVYATDVCDLLGHLISKNAKGHYVYNVAGKETINLRNVVDIISAVTGKPANIEVSKAKATTSIGAVEIPGWEPCTNVDEGIYKTFFGA